MDIIMAAAAALSPISERGITVKQGWYDESLHQTHITLWNLSDTNEDYSDGRAETESGYLQVNIWSKDDAVKLKRQVKQLLQNAGFLYEDGQDVEEENGLFNKAMRFYKLEESEE